MPACNEADGVGSVVRELLGEIDGLSGDRDTRMIVADDGSSDATLRTLRGLARQNSRVEVVEHGTNRGFGAAVKAGLRVR